MTRTASRNLPYAAVACAACAWGTWALVLRRAEAIGPMPSALESAIVMAVLTAVAGIGSLRDRVAGKAPWRARGWVVFLGVADALNVALLFAAYKIAIAVSVLTHYLTPIFVAIAAPLLLRERLSSRTVLAIVGSFAGLAFILGPGAHAPDMWTSALLGAGSAVFYAS
ncbi:MAG: EamA family transporter, partial [Polyangiaceae bacterium]